MPGEGGTNDEGMRIKNANSPAECGTFSTIKNYSLPLGQTFGCPNGHLHR